MASDVSGRYSHIWIGLDLSSQKVGNLHYYLASANNRGSDGHFCNQWFQTGANLTSTPECDQCYLETIRKRAESPIEDRPAELQSMYSSLSASCTYQGAPATRTVSKLLISSPTATLQCTTRYTIKPGDTALDVSVSQAVGTHDLLTANGLPFDMSAFPTSGTLCIRNQCKTYIVRTGDSCRTIASSQRLALAELQTWNPSINGVCDNIGQMVDRTLCTTNPLGDFTVANATVVGSGTVAPLPNNVAPQTNTKCARYHNVTAGDDCGTLGIRYNIVLKDFRFLNPMVWENCTNLWLNSSYCVTPVGAIQSYPGYNKPTSTFSMVPENSTPIPWADVLADQPGASVLTIPIANDTRNDCWDYLWWNDTLGSAMSCSDVAFQYQLSMEQFLTWNPSLATSESNTSNPVARPDCKITPSSSYCVGLASPTPDAAPTLVPPSPRGAGEISTCVSWFLASLDCASHVALARLTMDTFYKLNPSVGSDCTTFVLGTYYCRGTSQELNTGSPTTTNPIVSTSTTPNNGVSTPTPTQSGMTSDCNKFYKVKPEDGCWAIANDNKIALNDFYTWNPAVGSSCGSLQADYYVCIGTSTPATPTTVSPSTTASAAPSPTSNISPNGLCGGSGGKTCKGSGFGDCCSASGYCGSSADYCGSGCQQSFGTCDQSAKTISPNGLCGGVNGYTCAGSSFGRCCSASGYCGSTGDYCGNGCQTTFGTCG